MNILEMGWRDLLFASWPMARAAVAARLPEGLLPDTHDGQAWLTVVAFENVEMRGPGVPAALGIRLPELNLRTYVTHDEGPGVYFFSLDADGVLGVVGARILYHLPYYYAQVSIERTDDLVRFRSERKHPSAPGARFAADYRPTGIETRPPEGSLDRFLLDRYRLYTRGAKGGLYRAEIEHVPWTVQPVDATIRDNTLLQAEGFLPPDEPPRLHYSRGRDVTASWLQRA